jgi:hypothetical protein
MHPAKEWTPRRYVKLRQAILDYVADLLAPGKYLSTQQQQYLSNVQLQSSSIAFTPEDKQP